MRVVLTQPQPRVAGLVVRVESAGHQVSTLGFQRIYDRLHESTVTEKLARLSEFDWVIPVSPNAIDTLSHFLSLRAQTLSSRVALIGPGSLERWQQAFEASPMEPPVQPAVTQQAESRQPPTRQLPLIPRGINFDANALLAEPEFARLEGQRVAIIQGAERAPVWADRLVQRGAQVTVIAAYRVDSIEPSSDEVMVLGEWLSQHQPLAPMVIVVSSAALAQACDAWMSRVLPADWRQALERCVWLTNHPNVTRTLQQAGWQQVQTLRPGEVSLLEGLESLG